MIVIQVYFPDKVYLILQVPFLIHVFIEFALEVLWYLFLDRFICNFRSSSHRAIASRIRSSCNFEASTSNSPPAVARLVVFDLRFTDPLPIFPNLQRLWSPLFHDTTAYRIALLPHSCLIMTSTCLWVALVSHILSWSPIWCDNIMHVCVLFAHFFHRRLFRDLLLWRSFALLVFGDV